MKKSPVSLAVLSALSTGALAQSSVTLYGIVDAAIAVEDTGEIGKGSRKVLNSGVGVRRTRLELRPCGDNDPVQLTNSWT
jgi:predicted porin